jgi:hypothetical protein
VDCDTLMFPGSFGNRRVSSGCSFSGVPDSFCVDMAEDLVGKLADVVIS